MTNVILYQHESFGLAIKIKEVFIMTFDEKIKALNDLAVAWYSTSQADSIHEAIFLK